MWLSGASPIYIMYMYISLMYIMYMLYFTEQWERQWCSYQYLVKYTLHLKKFTYTNILDICYTLQSSDGGYQARAQAIAHLKPHPTPASEDDQLAKDDDDDQGGDVGDVGIYVDGDGDFVKVMIFLPLLCYVCVAYTDLHWDGPESDTGAHIKRKQKNKRFIFFHQHSVGPGCFAFYMR